MLAVSAMETVWNDYQARSVACKPLKRQVGYQHRFSAHVQTNIPVPAVQLIIKWAVLGQILSKVYFP